MNQCQSIEESGERLFQSNRDDDKDELDNH